jgi:hypothetical protein
MSQVIDQTPVETPVATDLASEVRRVLAASPEPLTLSKIRAKLPVAFRGLGLEELGEGLRRQVAANVLVQYPKYRSSQDRFWDRSMPVHIAVLLRQALEDGPLAWPALRRKLPAYAVSQAESVLLEQTAQGLLHRHPSDKKRGGDRYGLQPADPRDYLRQELAVAFRNLESLGFSQAQLRAGALELLHDEEWSPTLPAGSESSAAAEAMDSAAPAIAGPDSESIRAEAPPAMPHAERPELF